MNVTMDSRIYAPFFGCILVLGLPLNVVSLWILMRRHSLKSPSAVIMINLAISDLLLVISLPLRIYSYATGKWPLSNMACILTTMLFRSNLRSSSIFVTLISVDRLLAVVYPLRSRHVRTSFNAWKAAAVTWLFVCLVNIPESVVLSTKLNNETTCFPPPRNSNIPFLQPTLIFTLLAVNILCTARVSWTLHKHVPDYARVNNKVNVMVIFVMNLVMFVICFLPMPIGIIMGEKAKHFITALVCVASVNCCLDPLLYYFSLDSFWKKKEHVDSSREL